MIFIIVCVCVCVCVSTGGIQNSGAGSGAHSLLPRVEFLLPGQWTADLPEGFQLDPCTRLSGPGDP